MKWNVSVPSTRLPMPHGPTLIPWHKGPISLEYKVDQMEARRGCLCLAQLAVREVLSCFLIEDWHCSHGEECLGGRCNMPSVLG